MNITTIEALYLTIIGVEALITLLIAWKTFCQPKKVRYVLLSFCVLTLPSCVVNAMTKMGRMPLHWNSFCYLLSTMIMLAIHFWLNLDVGKHLRPQGIQWTNPYIIIALISLCGSLGCLIAQIVILLIRHADFPFRPLFITGVCVAIACDSGIYIYSFSTLIQFRSQRRHKGQSRTTSLGVWFLVIQMIWYGLFGALYIWFFCQDWYLFDVHLVFDYLMRFILCLMFTWPPPNCAIEFMAERLFSSLSHESSNGKDNTIKISTFSKSKSNTIPFGYRQQKDTIEKYHGNNEDIEECRPDIFFSSDVAIIPNKS